MEDERSAPAELPTRSGNGPERLLGLRLRTLREVAGMTQQQLAARMTQLGFSMRQTTIAKIEAGQRPVRVNEAVTLADTFGVDISDLLADQVPSNEASAHPGETSPSLGGDRTQVRFAANFKRLRERAEISPDVVANRMRDMGYAFDPETVVDIEAGQRIVSLGEAVMLARSIGTVAEALTRPQGLAIRAAELEESAREVRAALADKGKQENRLASAADRLERVLQRAESDGIVAELPDEVTVGRRALEAAREARS
jgi:transcriptional regulator with XRE-family HTH domain